MLLNADDTILKESADTCTDQWMCYVSLYVNVYLYVEIPDSASATCLVNTTADANATRLSGMEN